MIFKVGDKIVNTSETPIAIIFVTEADRDNFIEILKTIGKFTSPEIQEKYDDFGAFCIHSKAWTREQFLEYTNINGNPLYTHENQEPIVK